MVFMLTWFSLTLSTSFLSVNANWRQLGDSTSLIFATNTNLLVHSSVLPGMSDHDVVLSHVKSNIKMCKKSSLKIYLFDKGKLDRFHDDLSDILQGYFSH